MDYGQLRAMVQELCLTIQNGLGMVNVSISRGVSILSD